MKGEGSTDKEEIPPEVWPEHWGAWRVFMAMGTQWLTAGMAGMRYGLNYAVLPTVAELTGVELSPDVFLDIRTMEAEALSAWSKRTSGA